MLSFYIDMLDDHEKKDKLISIYEKYYGTMLGVAKSIIPDHALAEDAVSESIITIIKNLHKIYDVSSHKTRVYIVIIVRSRSINILNKQNKHKSEHIEGEEISDGSIPVLDDLTAREACDNIISHIQALPKSLSEALFLSVVMGHSNKEISDLLRISNDAVRQRLSRAKAQVKTKLMLEGIEYGEK
ncbi:RNA polymerase sigma factor [Dehalobacterium formicoaceticum]|uniref:Sigma-70 family RNA polymerase sigma factor n=1 Tax=Dehalobacterium formicoaceticum TaxID=51515 RepID=A0ABT1Y3S2_9FIRM|nr:sigma-70 family RNA polymerase sigma factor [Dehalobacterium formicoaceticum]MCR6545522.1 sigma-70 family RNA polymerase sigma factor [Dehalobacterium formicoaceticum]